MKDKYIKQCKTIINTRTCNYISCNDCIIKKLNPDSDCETVNKEKLAIDYLQKNTNDGYSYYQQCKSIVDNDGDCPRINNFKSMYWFDFKNF